VSAFVADADPKKREKLVDQLLGRKEFVELWVMKFAELLRIRSDPNQNEGISYKAALLYFNWLQDQIGNNVPMDQVVQKLLSADGGTFDNPATNFYQVERDTLKVAEDTAQVFMGMRIQCAQCHNHPFDRWTQDDYYGFASFFAQVGRKPGEDPREQIVFDRAAAEVKHPIAGKNPKPKFLGGEDAEDRARAGPPGGAGQVAGQPREPVLRQEPGEHRLGPLPRPRDHRPGRRRPHQQPGRQPRAARRARLEVPGVQLRLQAAGPRHLHEPHVPARDQGERDERGRRAELRPRADPRIRAEVLLGRDRAGDRDEREVPRAAARGPGRARSPTGRRPASS
jgi:hypothetical protein